MSWTTFFTVFATIFVAEIGDKTQLATLLFSADAATSKWTVFAAASAALVCAAGIGVLVGGQLAQWIQPKTLHLIAGLGFIGIGVWTLVAR
ncbi:MAG: TMEM165/GDT1 family protein [Gammaproteobacteria bacterium]|nr:TMEM165/GDT1 family protein [Gammaproteobacteria bacterium]